MAYETMTVTTAMRRIHNNDLVLPAIQREYVWSEERIYAFFDSLFRGYPFGTLLFWNTKERVQYRDFLRDYTDGGRFALQTKPSNKHGTMVLDGQQRLQSLYIGLRGTHEQRFMYLNLLSGDRNGSVSEAQYELLFLSSMEAERRNESEKGQTLWVPLKEVEGIRDVAHRHARVREWTDRTGLEPGSPEGVRLAVTVETAQSRLKAEETLSFFTIDRNYGEDGYTTPIDEILEIFVRINSGGQVLGKSDLMFSLMQLHWEEAYDRLEDLCDELNRRGRFDFDKDFVIKCALVCLGRGARYKVDKLRDNETLSALQERFPVIRDALLHLVDVLVNTARIQDERILGSYNSLIPFVYYLYLQEGRPLKNEEERLAIARLLYLSLMTHVFSRYADSRIDAAVRDVFDPANERSPGSFPTGELEAFVGRTEGQDRITDDLLQRNLHLVMNIIEGGSLLPEGRRRHRPEYDHVFPQTPLRERDVAEDRINHYANMRLISKQENIWKRHQDPKEYFAENPSVLDRYLVPRELLDYERFDEFLAERRRRIWDRVQTVLGIPTERLPDDLK